MTWIQCVITAHTRVFLNLYSIQRSSYSTQVCSTTVVQTDSLVIFIASFPGPRPASHHLQYGKAGEGLVHFLTGVTSRVESW